MAEIIDKICKTLQEKVIPAAQKTQGIISDIAVSMMKRAEAMAKEADHSPPVAEPPKDNSDWAENHMQNTLPVVHGDETVAKVKRRLSSHPGILDAVELLFVTDTERRLQGVVSLSAFLAAKAQSTVDELMNGDVASVTPADHPEQMAEVALTHQIAAVPVVDDQGYLLGAVPAHKVFKMIREDHSQDMNRFVGIWRNSDQALSAIEGVPLQRVIHRLPWLIVGTVGCVLATTLMATFETTLRTDLAVAFFIPGIVYLADAIGTQSEAIAVRGLSFSGAPIMQLLKGELKTGLYLGAALAVMVFPFIWYAFDAKLAFAVSIALVCASSVATGIGLLFPSILSRLGMDPAYGSGPVATIVQDLLSLLVYLSVISLLIL